MVNPLHAVVLDSRSPPELFALVKDYLQTQDPSMKFLLCSSIVPVGSFLQCELVQNKTGKLSRIQIPLGCVVATVELSQGQTSLGFVSGGQ